MDYNIHKYQPITAKLFSIVQKKFAGKDDEQKVGYQLLTIFVDKTDIFGNTLYIIFSNNFYTS